MINMRLIQPAEARAKRAKINIWDKTQGLKRNPMNFVKKKKQLKKRSKKYESRK